MTCQTIQPSVYKVCRRDKNHKIIIQCATSTGNNAPGENSISKFVNLLTTWAMVKTVSRVGTGTSFIQGVNINQSSGIDFYIDYTSEVDFDRKLWIEFEGDRYEINGVEDIDKKHITLKFSASEKGSKLIAGNQR